MAERFVKWLVDRLLERFAPLWHRHKNPIRQPKLKIEEIVAVLKEGNNDKKRGD